MNRHANARPLEIAAEQLLSQPALNCAPIARAMYPELEPAAAAAKFHNKRRRVRYAKFSDTELRNLHRLLAEQLGPLLQAYQQLQSLAPAA